MPSLVNHLKSMKKAVTKQTKQAKPSAKKATKTATQTRKPLGVLETPKQVSVAPKKALQPTTGKTWISQNENQANIVAPLGKFTKPLGTTPIVQKPLPTTLPVLDTLELDLGVEEMTPSRLYQREKQIQFGYNTEGHKCYIATIPKDQRTKGMPRTPDKNTPCSKRSWDGQVRKWRRELHQYDPVVKMEDIGLIDTSASFSMVAQKDLAVPIFSS